MANKKMLQKKAEPSSGKSFALLSALTITEKALGFVLQAAIAAVMGATIVTDCYYATFELTMLIDQSLVAAITVILLKQYSDIINRNGITAGEDLLSNARQIIIPFMIVLSICIIITARYISFILAPAYDEEARAILVSNIRLLAFLPTINAFSLFYLVILRQKKQFLIVGLKSLFINCFVFLGLGVNIATKGTTSVPLCIAYNIGLMSYGLVAFLCTKKTANLRYQMPRLSDEFKQLLKMLGPLVLSNGIVRISLVFGRVMASMMGVGAVTCLTYAHMLSYFVEGVFIINISTVLLSDFIHLVTDNDAEKIVVKIKVAMSSMIILLLPISIITVIYSKQITSIVFFHGNFTMYDVERVASLVTCYAVGFVPAVISNIFMQTHYAYGETKKTLIITTIAITSNVIISIILAITIGLVGIAIGTCCSYAISAGLYAISTKKLVKGYKSIITKSFIMKIMVATIICASIASLVQISLNIPDIFSFALATVLATIGYVAALIITKEETVLIYTKRIIGSKK